MTCPAKINTPLALTSYHVRMEDLNPVLCGWHPDFSSTVNGLDVY
jgi:hypothetical protein